MANPLLLARQLGNLMAKGTLPAMAKVVPAAAVIPAPIACIEVVAVESPFHLSLMVLVFHRPQPNI